MKKTKKIFAATWLFFSLMAAAPAIVYANGNLTIVVKNPNQYAENQSWFTYEKKAGETIDDIATVKNLSNKAVKAHVYAVDATSNESGSFILKLENEEKANIGKWTKINAGEFVTIPAQQSVDFPFHLQIPENTSPGQYFGGLVLEEIGDEQVVPVAAAAGNGEKICCTNILVKTRIGLRIYLTIPGVIKDHLEWSDFKINQKNKSTNFQFEIKNSGNVALEPVATIEIFDGMGNQIDRFQKNLGESLPGTTTNPVINWEKQPFAGNFKATAKIDYKIKTSAAGLQQFHGSSEKNAKTINFTIVPWKTIFGAGLCILAGIGGYILYASRRRQISLNWENYEVQPQDNIMNIAKNHNVDWKKLARINKIKPPYLVNSGTTLRVPKTVHHQPSLFGEQHDNQKHE